MRLGAVLAFLIAVACGGALQHPARASSLLHDIEKGIKRIDRQLCSNVHSAKCKTSQTKSLLLRKPKARLGAPAAAPSKVLSVTPLKPAVAPNKVLPAIPLKPAVAPHVVAPLPKPRPAELNFDTKSQPGAPMIAPKPAPVVSPPPATKPPPPVAVAPVPPPVADQASACLKALAATGTSFAPVPQPETSLACQVDTPVRLNSLATKLGVVKLQDQPTVNCAFALKLSQFVDQTMQPLAQQSLSSAIVAMGTGPGFNCRGRNGDSSAKMSEHAIGDAVDIEYIKLANKSQIQVKDALIVQSPGFAFLRDLRASACTEFTTVLGPGANAAHAEHFHIDLEVRHGGFRLCE